MALTKAEVRDALRESILAEYADVPPAEEIDHVFSDRFLAFMSALIEEEKRGSWRLLSRKSRRVLVVAAILAVSMLLVACTPAWREAVSEFIVTVYERFVDYGAVTDTHEEIETIYTLNPIPEGFTLVSQTQRNPRLVKSIYQDELGKELVLQQSASGDFWGSIDREHGEFTILTEEDISVFLYISDTSTTAVWTYDGYYMRLRYYNKLNHSEIENLIASISPVE